jgi:hypothetical protein
LTITGIDVSSSTATTEPYLSIDVSPQERDALVRALGSDGTFEVSVHGGSPIGRWTVRSDEAWKPAVDLMIFADTIEGHFRWDVESVSYTLDLSGTPEALRSFAETIESELSGRSGHVHREWYHKNGSLYEGMVSFVFSLVSSDG